MKAATELSTAPLRIARSDKSLPILVATGPAGIAIRAGTVIEINGRTHRFDTETPVAPGELIAGNDYGIGIGADNEPFVDRLTGNPLIGDWFAGFHFAPGGNAAASSGGDTIPAINPLSLWDVEFRPDCHDPRGMALVDMPGGRRFWADIYLLGVEHDTEGTSRFGATIADGRDLPNRPDGAGRVKKLDFSTASEIVAHHGKRLLGAEEFFAAAYGVKERCSLVREPKRCGSLDDDAARFISRAGLFGVSGTMWQWGTDGHRDDPCPSLFGGSWISGSYSGSRCARLDDWPGFSGERLGARAACDHLNPA